MACARYQNANDCRPSNTDSGTANCSDQLVGARPPKCSTIANSKPKATQTDRYSTIRLRRLRIGCIEDQFLTSMPLITTNPVITSVLVGTVLVGRRLSMKPPMSVA